MPGEGGAFSLPGYGRYQVTRHVFPVLSVSIYQVISPQLFNLHWLKTLSGWKTIENVKDYFVPVEEECTLAHHWLASGFGQN